jgi:hypothetical protein
VDEREAPTPAPVARLPACSFLLSRSVMEACSVECVRASEPVEKEREGGRWRAEQRVRCRGGREGGEGRWGVTRCSGRPVESTIPMGKEGPQGQLMDRRAELKTTGESNRPAQDRSCGKRRAECVTQAHPFSVPASHHDDAHAAAFPLSCGRMWLGWPG